MAYNTPGVYIKEISKLPPSVAQVETAIPAFIGYTATNQYNGEDLQNKPLKIKSLAEYTLIFGGPMNESFSVSFTGEEVTTPPVLPAFIYKMYHSLQLYFANGGGPCYIVSVGTYNTSSPAVSNTELDAGLSALKKEDEPTLILFPDAVSLTSDTQYYALHANALMQAADLRDRFVIIDVYDGDEDFQEINKNVIDGDGSGGDPNGIRSTIGVNNLKYGAAYYPWLVTIYSFAYDPSAFTVSGISGVSVLKNDIPVDADELDSNTANLISQSLYHQNSSLYNKVITELGKLKMVLPAGPAVAGIYARVDKGRGVWKAPANESLLDVIKPTVKLDDDDQAGLNVTTSGKSINAIRKFTGKGTLVWGARTLAGNDNEWRYVNVRRFFNMVEESVKKATEPFVFEPNDASTWSKVRGMIENFLILQWRAGALQGAVPEDAFFVKVGLGETMTALDILEGRMVVEIGMAVVRPAEFIILKFSHKMVES